MSRKNFIWVISLHYIIFKYNNTKKNLPAKLGVFSGLFKVYSDLENNM